MRTVTTALAASAISCARRASSGSTWASASAVTRWSARWPRPAASPRPQRGARAAAGAQRAVAPLPYATAALVLTAVPSARPAGLAQYAASAVAVVKPGGFVVLVIDRRRAGSALAGELVQLLQRLGLLYWQHVVGLVAEIRGEQHAATPVLLGGVPAASTCCADAFGAAFAADEWRAATSAATTGTAAST